MLLRRLASADRHHHRIARGAILAAMFVMFAKLGAFAREIAIAWAYGTGGVVDAFQLSFNVATWLPLVLAGASTGLLVPRLVAVRGDPRAQRRFVEELNGAALGIGLLCLAVTAAAAVPAVDVIGRGLPASIRAQALHFTFAMLPVTFLMVVVALYFARLQAHERQVFAATDAIPPLLIALLLLLWRPAGDGTPLVVGLVAGTMLQVIVLLYLTSIHTHAVGGVSIRRSSGEWQNIYHDLFALLGAQALATLSLPYDNAFAATAGEGGIATYGYALRLIGLFISFGAVVFARAILPVLSEVAALRDSRRGASLARKWSAVLFALGVLIAGAAWLAAPLVVRLAFQRGAFTAEDARAVTDILRYGLWQLPFSFGALATVQWFAALRRYRIILFAAAAAALAKLIFNPLLYPVLGLPGLALATAAMYAANMAVMLFSLAKQDLETSKSPHAGH